jgi:hypothetical protein
MSTTTGKRPKLEPLDITCTSSDCAQGLHCFKATKKMLARNEGGKCRACGADLVDWKRVHKKDVADAAHTIKMLEYELIRHHFWHVEIDERAVNHARRKGKAGMHAAAEQRIRTSVGVKNSFDGRQTPKEGNALYYAQHATACCCRKCIEEWHGIPQDRALTEEEIQYMTELCVLYINQRLPQLTEHGENVPRRRKKRPRGGNGRGE